MQVPVSVCFAMLVATAGVSMMAASASAEVWVVDPLTKVFRDSTPADAPQEIRASGVRGEYVSAQLVVRPAAALPSLRVRTSALRQAGGKGRIAADHVRARFVGYVPVNKNTPYTPPEELVRAAPDDFPDPLLEVGTLRVEARQAQPIWITIQVPRDARAGEYRGKVDIEGEESISLPIALTVYPITLPARNPLWITNWFAHHNIAKYHSAAMWSDAYWEMLDKYARIMAEHGQNTVLTPLFALIDFYEEADGSWSFDFTRFDRWVRLFRAAGFRRIEGGHLGGRGPGGWESPDFWIHGFAVIDRKTGDRTEYERGPMYTPHIRRLLRDFLPALQAHLAKRGWLDDYLQHIADEPIAQNAKSYAAIARRLKRYAPELPRIDANMTPELTGSLEVWVPILDQFDRDHEFYMKRRKAGEEVWFYTCLAPRGKYPNRLIDFSLVKVRLLHWINYKFQADGYLHWGLNFWTETPFESVEAGDLPPGDNAIVYPGPDGPLSSIRFEAMRDGIEDYQLLRILEAKRGRAKALEICDSILREITDYEHDPEALLNARERVVAAIRGR